MSYPDPYDERSPQGMDEWWVTPLAVFIFVIPLIPAAILWVVLWVLP